MQHCIRVYMTIEKIGLLEHLLYTPNSNNVLQVISGHTQKENPFIPLEIGHYDMIDSIEKKRERERERESDFDELLFLIFDNPHILMLRLKLS